MKKKFGIAAGLLCLWAGSFAQDSTETSENFQRFAALPVLGYAEETGLKYGAMVLIFTRSDRAGENFSSFDFLVQGTTNGQLEVMASPDLYLWNGSVHSDITLTYWNWKAKYYGQGNDPDRDAYSRYDMDLFKFEAPIDISLLPSHARTLTIGPYFYLESNRASFRKNSALRPERSGGFRTGFGYQATIDLRDNVNWPTHGAFAQFRQVFYPEALGKFGFFSQTLDLRTYHYLFWETSVAAGAFYDIRKGDVPFDMLATLDGLKRFRGVERGMFLDRQSFSAQVEFRRTLFWRLAGTIFVEAGKVGSYFSELARNDWHFAPGFGGRLLLNRSEKTYARCDFSLVDGKYLGLTIYLREAF